MKSKFYKLTEAAIIGTTLYPESLKCLADIWKEYIIIPYFSLQNKMPIRCHCHHWTTDNVGKMKSSYRQFIHNLYHIC